MKLFYRVCIALVLLVLTACAQDNQQVITLNKASFHIEGVEQLQDIQLPDSWNESRPDVGGIGVYVLHFKVEETPNVLWALLLTRVSNNAKVYLNGKLLGEHGSFGGHSIVWNTPFIATIPQGFLHQGNNTVVVKVQAKANMFGRLLPIVVGDLNDVEPMYKTIYFGQVILSEIAAVFAFTMGMSLLLIWWYRREPLYGWFALGGLSWSLYSLYFFIIDFPLSLDMWVRFCFTNSFIMLSSMLIFIAMFMQWRFLRYIKLIVFTAIAGSLFICLMPSDRLFAAITWVMGVYAFMYSVLAVGLVNALRFEQSKRHAITSLIGIGSNIGLGLHDWMNIFFLWNQPYLLQYGQPLIFLVMGRHLLKDYMVALERSQATNAELDKQVREREVELKEALQRTVQADQERLILRERERIMADIHDGVGGHLVSALSVAESSQTETSQVLSQTIHQALDELRIVIDSLDADEQSFPQMLADFRYRYNQRLEKQGIQVKWNFKDVDALNVLRPEQSLQLLRILQELMTNVVKHAEATVLEVCLKVVAQNQVHICQLDVQDNGVGFDEPDNLGRGIGNMKRRASSIGGDLMLWSDQKGTKARLLFPIRL